MKVSVRVAAASIVLGMVIVLVGIGAGRGNLRRGRRRRPGDGRQRDAFHDEPAGALAVLAPPARRGARGPPARALPRAALNGTRSLFLQSDVDEFATYRATLAQATMMTGDTSAARANSSRGTCSASNWQEVAFSGQLLKANKFDFTRHDVYSFDREHAARPTDLTAAHALWQQQLRAEYLEEKLKVDKPAAQIVTFLQRRHEQQLRTMKGLRDDEGSSRRTLDASRTSTTRTPTTSATRRCRTCRSR